ncbi:MAG: protein-L-isoaspartate(D-aspartate) O-methyltransferase [Gammaproteobacteria bacterium]
MGIGFLNSLMAADYTAERQAMIRAIQADVIETSVYIGKEAFDPAVMRAMASVPRHEFVPQNQKAHAYENRPLPIGYGQTISQPYIVALMTDLLGLSKDDKVLEIGTGSGYQAAILNELTAHVFTIEIIEPLGKKAIETYKRLHLDNINVRIGDGYFGWEEQAPFDAIIVTAAADHVPPPLVKQLKNGGRMVIPVGSRFFVQQLVLVTKDDKGKITTKQLLPVRFVPLTGKH